MLTSGLLGTWSLTRSTRCHFHTPLGELHHVNQRASQRARTRFVGGIFRTSQLAGLPQEMGQLLGPIAR